MEQIIFQIEELPDFSDLRFQYLGEKTEERKNEIIKKQMQMIRRFHDLGEDWRISMRFRKEGQYLKIYYIFFYAGDSIWTKDEKVRQISQIYSMFLPEYTLKYVDEMFEEKVTDISWANYSAELFKQEELYQGNIMSYYASSLWMGVSNDLRMLCNTMMQSQGKVEVEVTLEPTIFMADERKWVNNCLQQLKEVQMGERLRNDDGKVLMQYDPIPMFATPIDNYNKLMKRYEGNKLFYTALRIFTENNPDNMVSAVLNGSVKNNASRRYFVRGSLEYEIHIHSHKNVEISNEIVSELWMTEEMPLRAKRLNRLCDIEEISNFMRIPVPVENHFPGFLLDTGMGGNGKKKQAKLNIRLGNYIDDSSGNDVEANMDAQQMAKHGLIVGVPGSGKTTAMFNILHQLWDAPVENRIPFIVLEPAKTEFRALKTIPHFKDSLLVFTLGDEGTSPFRFNPFEVLPGIPLERHISRLNACFVGAFNLFDPLPVLLDQAIRRTYMEKGWYEDSVGGEPGVETPTLTDLCKNAEYIVTHSGFDDRMASDFKASLLQRLNSLRRGSKGRMLDTKYSIPMEELMEQPVILELDALNEDEKSLMMMFLLSFVYEYCKVKRKSGSPLRHMLLVEEAHNLIGATHGNGERANPKEQTIKLFVNMLAEMRALGEGMLIADQLPTAIAPQAVKQTNVKILMRVTAKDDREEIGNTMDLSEKEMRNVVHFKTGHAYIFHEALDRVRMMRMVNYKGEYGVEEPPEDLELHEMMKYYIERHREIYLPYQKCQETCECCTSRVRSQAEQFANWFLHEKEKGTLYQKTEGDRNFKGKGEAGKKPFPKCAMCVVAIKQKKEQLEKRYGMVGKAFATCALMHMYEKYPQEFEDCKDCGKCSQDRIDHYFEVAGRI